MSSGVFIDGAVRYPEDLPCPQVDTDLRPRERRYISDIGEVKKLRAFQLAFQATRQNISFVFTAEQSLRFRDWYKNEVIEGGAWFYADWPVLHLEKRIAYRFVTRPVWKFLARKTYHVSATVETFFDRRGDASGAYEPRRIYKEVRAYTSKIYPYYFAGSFKYHGAIAKAMPSIKEYDNVARRGQVVVSGQYKNYIYSSYTLQQGKIARGGAVIVAASSSGHIYSSYTIEDEGVDMTGAVIVSGTKEEHPEPGIFYDYFVAGVKRQGFVILAGDSND